MKILGGKVKNQKPVKETANKIFPIKKRLEKTTSFKIKTGFKYPIFKAAE